MNQRAVPSRPGGRVGGALVGRPAAREPIPECLETDAVRRWSEPLSLVMRTATAREGRSSA